MNTLPAPTLDAVERMARACAERATNERFKSIKGLVTNAGKDDQEKIDAATRDLTTKLGAAKLSAASVQSIIDICHAATWMTANERDGNKADVAKDEKKAKEAMAKLVTAKEVSLALATNVAEFITYIGWHTVNTRMVEQGKIIYVKDVDSDKQKVEQAMAKILGVPAPVAAAAPAKK